MSSLMILIIIFISASLQIKAKMKAKLPSFDGEESRAMIVSFISYVFNKIITVAFVMISSDFQVK